MPDCSWSMLEPAVPPMISCFLLASCANAVLLTPKDAAVMVAMDAAAAKTERRVKRDKDMMLKSPEARMRG